MTSGRFKLYPEERHWWSFQDYGAVLETMRELRPARVLEFGPGSSTLALIEGGATTIDTCEDNPDWASVYEDRLQGKFPEVVRVHRYTVGEPLTIPAIDGQTYDLALIDGPLGTNRRPDVVRYCLDRCRAVLAPTEDGNPAFRLALHAIAAERGWDIAIRETGPLSGGFALLTRRETGFFVPPGSIPIAEWLAAPVDGATLSGDGTGKALPPFSTEERTFEPEESPETAAADPSTLDTPGDPTPLSNTMVPPATLTKRKDRRRKGRA